MPTATRTQLTRLRLLSQRIERPDSPTPGLDTAEASPVDVVRWMTAMQAQDLPGVKWSVGLRAEGSTLTTVDDALNSGAVVRSWPFRGTLHLVAGEDLGWKLDLTAARMVAGARTRHRQLGLDDTVFEAARAVAVESLAGGVALTRDQLFARFAEAGIATDTNRGSNLLWYLAHTKTICFGPMRGSAQALVLLDEWVTAPRSLDRDESLGELATRYFRSHGPATLKDFLWWSKLLVPEAKRGLEIAADRLETVDYDGQTYWLAEGLQGASASRGSRSSVDLLPGFDEYLLGYTDRRAALDEQYSQRIVPGNNGIFLPTVVSGGIVVGTWSRTATSTQVAVTPEPFAEFSSAQTGGIRKRASRYADFLGRELR
ncbi:winged helix DNA-binding domain-containing protein [Subtercola sp. PAMC28395]|uniref:winged helix DNA-binding domain-containing protein n=1 Tax=Subtercola sp. PAMC28395 TaxID=2846775 RepID=UPI001C0BCA01|nr:winged helix DNA-binding domain-containing protein [Subtercola sp. PAMC28395]QWT23015.1 winged helix DNA-binding domain-containing protein [Subtercola sp. PAMC28395]